MAKYRVRGYDKDGAELFDKQTDAPTEAVARLYVLAEIRRRGFPEILKAERAVRFEVKPVRRRRPG